MANFVGWVRTQSHRMEGYTVITLLVAILGFSHVLGHWPRGTVPVSGTAMPGVTAATSPPGKLEASGGLSVNTEEVIWRIVFLLSLLGVGVLYYFGRLAGANNNRKLDISGKEMKSSAGESGESPNFSGKRIGLVMRRLAVPGGGAEFIDAWTPGDGEHVLGLGGHPSKVLFDPLGIIVNESEGSIDLVIEGKQLTVASFAPQGLSLNDYGSPIRVRVYILEGEPA